MTPTDGNPKEGLKPQEIEGSPASPPAKLDYSNPRHRGSAGPSATAILGTLFGLGFIVFALLTIVAALGQFGRASEAGNGIDARTDTRNGWAFVVVSALSATGAFCCLGVNRIRRAGIRDAFVLVIPGLGGAALLVISVMFVVSVLRTEPQTWPWLSVPLTLLLAAGGGGLWIAAKAARGLYRGRR